MKKIVLIILVLAITSCTKGPLTQVSQSRHSGGFFASMNSRVVQDSQLVTDGEFFYFGTRKGKVFCVREKNQRHAWTIKLPASVDTSVLVDQNHAYVGAGNGRVYGLDRKTGKILWNTSVSSPPRGVMTKIGNQVIVGTNEGILIALDQDNGNTLWKYHHEPYEKMKIQFMVQGSVEQNKLFIGFPNGQLVALDAQTGTEIWKRWVMDSQDRFYDLSSVILVPGKGVLATLVSGPSIFFNFDGRDLWTYKNASTQAAPILLEDRILIATHDKIQWLGLDGSDKGSIPYKKSIRPAGIAYDKGLIYVSALDGSLNVMDEKTSSWLWEYQMGVSIQGAPIVLKDKIWVLNRRGQLIAMRRR
jgi:outer membrane protein assembly factor BamB